MCIRDSLRIGHQVRALPLSSLARRPCQANQSTDRTFRLDVLEEPFNLGVLLNRSETFWDCKLAWLLYRSEPFRNGKLFRRIRSRDWPRDNLGGIEEPLPCTGRNWPPGRRLLLDKVPDRIRAERSKPLPERIH